ncbi:MAG: DUF4097 family beta strand repeat protein [Gemmatimonadetes bacterium]|nr:DUF4097 family beta strand repeat protein [Gemmatimonadota bacterium]
MRIGLIAAGAAAAMVAAGTAGAQERYTLDGDHVAVYDLAGQVNVEAGRGSAVTVEVTRGGADARDLTIRRGDADGFRHLAIVTPGSEVVYDPMGRGSNTSVRVRDDGTFGNGDHWLGGRTVRIQGAGSGTRAWADLRVIVPEGRTVAVHLAVGHVDVANVNGDLRVKTAAAAIRATGTRGPLNLDTGSGGIEVTDADGDIRLDTGSGGVRVSNVRGTGLNIDTGSGGVQGGGLAVGRLHVDVGSGGVRLDGVDSRNIDVDTGSGSVNLQLRGDAEYLKIDTGSGGVVLGLPSVFGAEADIDTGSGGIQVDVPSTARRVSRDHFTGSIGDGKGRLIIDTGSGGVRLERAGS